MIKIKNYKKGSKEELVLDISIDAIYNMINCKSNGCELINKFAECIPEDTCLEVKSFGKYLKENDINCFEVQKLLPQWYYDQLLNYMEENHIGAYGREIKEIITKLPPDNIINIIEHLACFFNAIKNIEELHDIVYLYRNIRYLF